VQYFSLALALRRFPFFQTQTIMSVVLATAGYDHKIRFWEAPSGVCSRIIKFPDSQVNRLEITPDKQFIAAAGNPVIRLYEIMSSAPSANSNNPSSANDGTGHHHHHQQQSQQAVLTLEGHTSNVTAIGFQKDGRYLYSGSEDGTIKVWDLRNPNYSRSFHSGSAVNAVCLRADRDEFISGDANGNVKIWDLGGGGAGNKDGCINSVKPSEGGGASNATIGGGYSVPIQAVDISEDSRTLVAVTNHGTVLVWHPSSGSAVAAAAGRSSPVEEVQDDTAIESSVDGGSIPSAAGSSHHQALLRPITKFRAQAPGSYCLHARIAPDCRHLVTTGSDGMALLWDTATWDLTERLQCCHNGWVWDAAFCADSSYLVTASSDHIARLWNLRTGEVVRKYHGHQSAVTCVALNDSSV